MFEERMNYITNYKESSWQGKENNPKFIWFAHLLGFWLSPCLDPV